MVRSLLSAEEKKKYFIKFNVDGLLRGDYQSRMNGYATARQNGWMSANDIRELENLDRIPEDQGGDLYLVNGNMMKLQDAGAGYGKGGAAEFGGNGNSGGGANNPDKDEGSIKERLNRTKNKKNTEVCDETEVLELDKESE